MGRGVVGVQKSLQGAGRTKRAHAAVLVEIEAIERPRVALDIPVDTFIRVEFAVGVSKRGIQRVKGLSKGLGCVQILLRALGIQEPEELILDNSSAQIATELFALERGCRWTRQGSGGLVAPEISETLPVYGVAA